MTNLKKIPTFQNEDEEAKFWASHDFTEYYDTSKRVSPNFPNLKPTTQSVTVRLPKIMVRQLKMLANEQDIPYQSYMKMLLDEKLKDRLAIKRKISE
jgi:predicted DNA binding CopG/RHH family protein